VFICILIVTQMKQEQEILNELDFIFVTCLDCTCDTTDDILSYIDINTKHSNSSEHLVVVYSEEEYTNIDPDLNNTHQVTWLPLVAASTPLINKHNKALSLTQKIEQMKLVMDKIATTPALYIWIPFWSTDKRYASLTDVGCCLLHQSKDKLDKMSLSYKMTVKDDIILGSCNALRMVDFSTC